MIGTKINDLGLCLEVVSRSCQPFVLHSTLNISETVRDRGLKLVPKDHQYGLYGESTGHVTVDVTDVTLKGQIRNPNTLTTQYLESSLICYLATNTIANYYIICCEPVSMIGYPSDSLSSCQAPKQEAKLSVAYSKALGALDSYLVAPQLLRPSPNC